MKRLGNIWNTICSRENIIQAIQLAGQKVDEDLINTIQKNLIEETYTFGPYTKMIVYEPKERIIHYPEDKTDKIYHKCLLNVTGEFFVNKLPKDSYASIKGRGLTKACEKIKKFLRTHKDWYFLQADVHKYYDNIDHEILKTILRSYIKDTKALKLMDRLIDSYPKGVPIGNHTSQYFANLYFGRLGHKIKEYYKVPFMIIYMDDFLFMFPSKAEATKFKECFLQELSKLKLKLKPNTRIAPVSYGINILGYTFFPTHTRLRKKIKVNMKKQLRRYRNADDATFKLKLASHYGWCKHGDCKNLLRKVLKDKYKLFEFKKLSECGFFGLTKDKFVSITQLYGKELGFVDCQKVNINNQDKLAIKFVYLDNQSEPHYTLTRSKVITDRMEKDKSNLPFIATFKNTGKYSYYE